MAENENQQERTEQPTAKRREQARERGQVARSTDLSAAAVILVASGALQLVGGYGALQLHSLMKVSLAISHERAMDESAALPALGNAAVHGFLACAPFFALTIVAALVAPMALGGRSFSLTPLAPDFTRLNPMSGFARMFSLRGAVELAKAFAKFALLATIGGIWLWNQRGELMHLGFEPTAVAVAHAATLSGHALMWLAAGLGIIAAIDVPWQLWQHTRQLRMSRTELREEMRESEGAPEIKARIRAMLREMAKRRMMTDVPKADVVVVNPTHYAVALRYDEERMRAPVVVAKGMDLIAARIREIATEHGVPIFEAPPLARALHRHVEIGAEIPAALYVAVAQVLTYLAQLRTARQVGASPPPQPTIDPSIDPDAPRH